MNLKQQMEEAERRCEQERIEEIEWWKTIGATFIIGLILGVLGGALLI